MVLIFSALICLFGLGHPATAETGENKRLQEGKITKNEAQHLVLKRFPGAAVKNCQLKVGANGHSVWVVTVIKPNEKSPIEIQVDGETGRLKL